MPMQLFQTRLDCSRVLRLTRGRGGVGGVSGRMGGAGGGDRRPALAEPPRERSLLLELYMLARRAWIAAECCDSPRALN